MTLFGLLSMWACLNCVSGCRWITYRKPCSNTQGPNCCQKEHGVSRKHILFIFPLFFLCHVTFRQLLLTLSLSCTSSQAYALTLLLSFFIFLLRYIATSAQTFLMMSSSQSLPDCSWLGQSRPSKEEGLSHGIGCYFLLVNLHLKSPQRIHNTYIHIHNH